MVRFLRAHRAEYLSAPLGSPHYAPENEESCIHDQIDAVAIAYATLIIILYWQCSCKTLNLFPEDGLYIDDP